MSSVTPQSQTVVSPGPADGSPAAPGLAVYQWLLAWAAFLALAWLFNQSDFGHTTMYYLLVLTIVLLLVTQYQWFQGVLAPLARVTATGGGNAT